MGEQHHSQYVYTTCAVPKKVEEKGDEKVEKQQKGKGKQQEKKGKAAAKEEKETTEKA